ncbi:MAG: TIR domain-containing protein, partial [Ktedonobacteraceae bacterium]|nr:TIR domain-containing protein [Ktedonobacteraceae bacterium]
MMTDISTHKDFFVSYSSADRLWAEWITWQLERANYSVMLQTWHFQPGQDFVQHMQNAVRETRRTIVVLSPDYLDELEEHSGWAQIFGSDSVRRQEVLLPVQVRECRSHLKGLLSLLTYIDLVGRDEEEALAILLSGIRRMNDSVPKRSGDTGFTEHVVAEQPRFPVTLPRIWNVPPRNRFFTDREEILEQLHNIFASKKTHVHMLSQAISGLGGIGKTQIAVEYAYRYSNEYQAVIWLFAESRDMLVQSCHDLLRTLELPEKDAQDHEEIVDAVREWLQDHIDWLLILDNADDPSLVRDFFPSAASGHVLMTTRAQAVGRVAQCIIVEKMPLEEGALFLLRRADLLGPGELLQEDDPQWQDALRVVEVMGGLPLALDQAGGYIEETS